jgi:hypothetical protein
MNSRIKFISAAVLVVALTVPAVAYAQSLYVRKSASSNAYSASSSLYYKSNQGSVEEGGIAGMFSTIYSRTTSTSSWATRKTVLAVPGGSNSSSVGSNGTLYYWRLGLAGPLSAGYGIINAFN